MLSMGRRQLSGRYRCYCHVETHNGHCTMASFVWPPSILEGVMCDLWSYYPGPAFPLSFGLQPNHKPLWVAFARAIGLEGVHKINKTSVQRAWCLMQIPIPPQLRQQSAHTRPFRLGLQLNQHTTHQTQHTKVSFVTWQKK